MKARGRQEPEREALFVGVSHETVRRAEAIATLPLAVRDQAREEHWSQERLLDMARDKDIPDARRSSREAEKATVTP